MDVLTLAQALIEKASVTPHDAGCQEMITAYLSGLGFKSVALPSGPVSNLWAEYGNQRPLFVFAGHTDVVPAGDETKWQFNPFKATLHNGYLYGRGAQDMKSGLAAMLVATRQFIEKHAEFKGSIGFLITSGEEGDDSHHGTPVVIDYLKSHDKTMDWCVVGEPSSSSISGDTIRHGRRGSMHGLLTVHGIQGHVAYPERADNPIHKALPALTELTAQQWDQGDAHFRPTTLQISNINAGTGAGNVIPGELNLRFNFRHSPASTSSSLQERTEAILNHHHLKYSLNWSISGEPFMTTPGKLLEATNAAIALHTNRTPQYDTGGGTSDARFIAPTGCEVIELGTPGDTIHQVNEKIRIEELDKLVSIYESLLEARFIS